MKRVTINREQRLFVIPSPRGGYSCLGFDVCKERSDKLSVELGLPIPRAKQGSLAAYHAYVKLCDEVFKRNQANRFRSSAELTPQLIGLEGKRVEVTHRWPKSGTVEIVRFQVGKSTGWIPIHLAIARRTSSGGPAVCLGDIISVRVL